MTDAVSVAAWLAVLAAGLPLAIYAVELLAGLFPSGRSTPPCLSARTTILIPAHDEAATIAATIDALQSQRNDLVDILVVADNCTDATAQIARVHGAEVLERHDEERRGKGFALAAGRDWIARRDVQPEVVIVIDADCRLLPGSIAALVGEAMESARPIQAVNLIEADLAAAPMVQISGFAMLVKNLYRSRGMQRLGGAALLTGTGMAFPWPIFAAADLATGSIVEDLGLGIALTEQGLAPRLVTTAGVRSAPADMRDALAQRSRWEHGFLSMLTSRALPLIGAGITRRSLPTLLLGLHLAVPPLALLLGTSSVILAGLLIVAMLGWGAAPFVALAIVLALALLLTMVVWLTAGRDWLAPGALAQVPLYLVWKLPMYLRFLRAPQTRWNRTPRGSKDS